MRLHPLRTLYAGAVIWVHPKAGGDDERYEVDFAVAVEENKAKKLVMGFLKKKKSAILDDFTLIEA